MREERVKARTPRMRGKRAETKMREKRAETRAPRLRGKRAEVRTPRM